MKRIATAIIAVLLMGAASYTQAGTIRRISTTTISAPGSYSVNMDRYGTIINLAVADSGQYNIKCYNGTVGLSLKRLDGPTVSSYTIANGTTSVSTTMYAGSSYQLTLKPTQLLGGTCNAVIEIVRAYQPVTQVVTLSTSSCSTYPRRVVVPRITCKPTIRRYPSCSYTTRRYPTYRSTSHHRKPSPRTMPSRGHRPTSRSLFSISLKF